MPITFTFAQSIDTLPGTVTIPALSHSVVTWMHPYADTLPDTQQGILDALQNRPAPGGFVLCATSNGTLVGALVMLRTGMNGYIPPNLLLFLAVDPSKRRSGIGTALVKMALQHTKGSIKLHVEPDNPATSLYKKLGFLPTYLDMRLQRKEQRHEQTVH